MTEECGPLVRLWGIHPSQLPHADAKGEDLKPFLSSILNEAIPFIDIEKPSWKRKFQKSFPNSIAPVQVYERTVAANQLAAAAEKHHPPGIAGSSVRDEFWALRQSVHENREEKGSASWAEFVRCFKEEHAVAEVAFTPGILGTTLNREWDCAGVEIETDGVKWMDLTLKREESTHKLPGPLKKRLFPVVQVTAATVREGQRREVIVVQILARPGDDEEVAEGVVRAAYSSVEVVRETAEGKVEWIMGTASDAGGILPMWMQKTAVPGQIAKDVDMFMKWVGEERKKENSEILRGLT